MPACFNLGYRYDIKALIKISFDIYEKLGKASTPTPFRMTLS